MSIKLKVYVCLKYYDIHVHQEYAVWRLARRIPAGLGFEGPGSGATDACPYVCLCMIIIYSLGTLHNPIGVVASW